MQSTGTARLLYTIEELDEQKGFVIAPFCPSDSLPIVLIEPDCFEIPQLPLAGSPKQCQPDPNNTCFASPEAVKEHYREAFRRFIEPLQRKKFDKLVLSRSQTIGRASGFSATAAFYQACRQYKYSYIYLCHTPQTGTWMGSTPEIILAGQQGEWHTVALAGTQPLQNDGCLPTSWDEKNKEEQGIVAAYVRNQLDSLGIRFTEQAPCPVHAGALSHLRSDFGFSLPDNRKLGDLLKRLHPTPAVCGLPKEEAYRFILDNEGHNRRYYSGFIGWLDPEGKSDLYVNLRCMHIHPHAFTLYAGGGLLASSCLESEWQETEAKMQTMARLLSR